MKAEIIVRFTAKNLCNREDIKQYGSFEKLVKYLIKEEGLFGVTDDNFKVISVKEIPSKNNKRFKTPNQGERV